METVSRLQSCESSVLQAQQFVLWIYWHLMYPNEELFGFLFVFGFFDSDNIRSNSYWYGVNIQIIYFMFNKHTCHFSQGKVFKDSEVLISSMKQK